MKDIEMIENKVKESQDSGNMTEHLDTASEIIDKAEAVSKEMMNTEEAEMAINDLVDYLNSDRTDISDGAERLLEEAGITRESTSNIKTAEDILTLVIPLAAKYSVAIPVILGKLGLEGLENFPKVIDALATGSKETLEFIFNNGEIIEDFVDFLAPKMLEWFVDTKLLDSKVRENYAYGSLLSLVKNATSNDQFSAFMTTLSNALVALSATKNWGKALGNFFLHQPFDVNYGGVTWTIYSMGDFRIAVPHKNVLGMDVKVYKIKPSYVQKAGSALLSFIPYLGGLIASGWEGILNADDMAEIYTRLNKAGSPENVEQIIKSLWDMLDMKKIDQALKEQSNKFLNTDSTTSDDSASDTLGSKDTVESDFLESLISSPGASQEIQDNIMHNNIAASPALAGLFDNSKRLSASGGSESNFRYSSRGRIRKKY